MAVPCDITAITEVYQPVLERLWHLVYRATNVRQFSERLDALNDGFGGPLGRYGVLGSQKLVQPLQVPDRCRGEDHL